MCLIPCANLMSHGSFFQLTLPAEWCKRPVVVLQMFIEIQENNQFHFHPLVHRRLGASNPISIVGPAVECKAAQTEPSASESYDGQKWLTISLYDTGSTHAYCILHTGAWRKTVLTPFVPQLVHSLGSKQHQPNVVK